MKVTLKLFASLSDFLPRDADRNRIEIELGEGASVASVIDAWQLPLESCHLVLVDGVFVAPEERASRLLEPGEVLAIWPPVAGG